MSQSFGRIFQSGTGFVRGIFKISTDTVSWTNPVDGKENAIAKADIEDVAWTMVNSGCVLCLTMRGGTFANNIRSRFA